MSGGAQGRKDRIGGGGGRDRVPCGGELRTSSARTTCSGVMVVLLSLVEISLASEATHWTNSVHASIQGLTLVHVRAQREQLLDTFMS